MDTTPLFATADISSLRPKTSRSSQGLKQEKKASAQNLSDVLDDILNTPTRSGGNALNDSPVSTPLPPAPLQLNTQSAPPPQYSDEMEWSPTFSPPPAFKDFGTTKPQPFGQPQSPGDQPQRPFWARVPPAPKPPAQRLYNAAPPAAEAIKQDRQHFSARFGGNTLECRGSPKGDSVEFTQPSFFPTTGKDPRSGLADLLNSSFSLSQEGEERPASRAARNPQKNPFSPGKLPPVKPSGRDSASVQNSRAVDACFLVAILGLWIYAVQNPGSPSYQMMKASLAMAVVHILRITYGTVQRGVTAGRAVSLVLCAGELGAVGYVASKIWAGDGTCKGCFGEGLWTMVVMLAHHLFEVLG